MDLTHSFTVPAAVDDAWATFMDLEQVGACFPGATVTSATDDGFEGTVKVKLGPIALVYAGSGTFTERDDTAHRAVIEAKGKDKRGNGTAGATVTFELSDAGEGSTRAQVQTDLAVTGKPAQFGRGVMQDVSDKLLGQFIACIEGKVGDANPHDAADPGLQGSHPVGTKPASAAGPEVPAPAAEVPAPVTLAPVAPQPTPPKEQDDALDLGSTVLPILLRSYGKQVAIGVVVVVAVIVIWRAMSG